MLQFFTNIKRPSRNPVGLTVKTVDESTDIGIVVSRLEVVQTGLLEIAVAI